jgi:hypothetical protein
VPNPVHLPETHQSDMNKSRNRRPHQMGIV